MKLRDAIEQFMLFVKEKHSEGTVGVYNQVFINFIRDMCITSKLLDKDVASVLDRRGVLNIYTTFLAKNRKGRSYMDKVQTAFSSMNQWLIMKGAMKINWFRQIDPFKLPGVNIVPLPPRVPITEAEYEKILAVCVGVEERWRLPVMLGWHCGMRIGDAMSLQKSWVHLDEKYIQYIPQKTRKCNRVLTVPISTELAAELAKAMEGADEFVFPWAVRLYRTQQFNACTRFKQLAIRAGVKGKTFHCFRHAFVSRLVSRGCSTEMIQSISGQSPKIIMHYCKPEIEEKRKAMGLT